MLLLVLRVVHRLGAAVEIDTPDPTATDCHIRVVQKVDNPIGYIS